MRATTTTTTTIITTTDPEIRLAPLAFLKDPAWRREVLQDAFGKGFFGFLAAAVVTGIICYLVKGQEAFTHALIRDAKLLLSLLPRVVVALSIAALIWFMLPRDKVSAHLGQESGFKGLLIATAAGTVTPGGPSSAYALLAVLAVSGADRGAMVAYITAWATLGMQRILMWDVPFMGAEFAFLRVLISLPLPIVAGLIARRLPFELRVKDAPAEPREVKP